MHYKVELSGRYMPSFQKHSEIIIDKVIEIVEDCFEKLCTKHERGVPVTHNERFTNLVRDQITTGYIAELCLDLTHTFRANKNWNWHGASVGASICAIASDIGDIINQHAGTMTPELCQVMQSVLAKHSKGSPE